MRIANSLKVPVLAVLAGLTFGCASTGDMQALKDMHEQDMQRAMATANEAKATADEARATAAEALRVANEANQRSMATEEKINRMFQRSMMK